MYELWAINGDGWKCVFRADQRWKVEHEASRWPKWQTEIVEAVAR